MKKQYKRKNMQFQGRKSKVCCREEWKLEELEIKSTIGIRISFCKWMLAGELE